MEDTDLVPASDDDHGATADTTNLLYAAGGEMISASGCGPGRYGSCTVLDDGAGYTCLIGECSACPPGTFRASPGALLVSDCLPCESGTFAANPTGASFCETCEAGSVSRVWVGVCA